MSNEGYWMLHEMGEEYRRKYIFLTRGRHHLYCSELRSKFAEWNSRPNKTYLGLPCYIFVEILNESQRRGRLIVGGKVSE